MKNDSASDLLELGGMMHRGYSSIIANAGKIIAFITLTVAILVSFTDMAFSDLTSESFTTTLMVMLISSDLMYFSLEDTGEREGEESEEFKAAYEKYTIARAKITPEDIDSLRAFCLDYSMRELKYRRLCYLGEMGYSESDYTAYKSGKKFPLRGVRVFRRAERMKAVNLSPSVLMSGNHNSIYGELTDPKRRKLIDALFSLIPSTLCTIFTVSVILTAKENMTLSSVIDSLVKLSALPIVGFKGMMDGFRFAREDKSAWLETKARLLESFVDGK